MLHFAHPEAWLLTVVLAVTFRRQLLVGHGLVRLLRVLVLIAGSGLLAGTYIESGLVGRDLVLVVDRSESVGQRFADKTDELSKLAKKRLQDDDRIGLVSVARTVEVDKAPTGDFQPQPLASVVKLDATDLALGIRTALTLIPTGRPGALLVISDGEVNTGDTRAAALAARERGVAVDTVLLRRPGAIDVRVESIGAPLRAGVGEPVLIPVWIHSDVMRETGYRLLRDDVVIAEGMVALRPGRNRILARDRLATPGIHRYRAELLGLEDRVQENNQAQTAMRVVAAPRVLCVTPGGRQDRLTHSLHLSHIDLEIVAPQQAPLSLDALDSFRVVVLENVPAGDLPHGSLQNLERYVEDMGGGLLMTGGKASFGVGGYRRSPVENVLPVTLEVRREQRRFAVAMAIALDRSGSMTAPAGPGLTKMDLANRGTAAAIEMLNPMDHVAVIAVDSAPHTVVGMQRVDDAGAIIDKVLKIESMGGGIFTSTAVHAAAKELAEAPQGIKHMVIFADAADAEEPGDLHEFVPKLVSAGVSLSVIALGSNTDSDAQFLMGLATLGGGRCTFVQSPDELPRVFAEEAIRTLQASFSENPTEIELQPAIEVLQSGVRAIPTVGGYSIAYAREEAQIAATTKDDHTAPMLAFWQRGLGRAATWLAEADGDYSGELVNWDGYGNLVVSTVRWLAGNEPPADIHASVSRAGRTATVRLEAASGAEALLPRTTGSVIDDDGVVHELVFKRTGAQSMEAQFPLTGTGVYRPVVRFNNNASLRLDPLVLPVAMEHSPPRDVRAGERTLRQLAGLSGGLFEPTADQLLRGSRMGLGRTELTVALAIAALLLLLLEIAVRRLGMGQSLANATVDHARKLRAVPKKVKRAGATGGADERAAAPSATAGADLQRAKQADMLTSLKRARERAKRR